MTASDDRPDSIEDALGDFADRHERLNDLVNYDELTGHLNRTRLREAVDRTIAVAQRRADAAAFMAVGVDSMNAINDEIGRRLDECLRLSDLVGRLGGDRFGIVLPLCPDEHIATAAEKILEAMRSAPIVTERGPVAATVSIGVASFCDRGSTSYEVMTRA